MSNKTILIVDDSRIARKVSMAIIAHLRPDITVLEAASSSEALAAVNDHNIHAIILDHSMPDRTGMELAAELRVSHPDIAISMLTANVQNVMKARALELGIGFMEKPPTEAPMKAFLEDLGI